MKLTFPPEVEAVRAEFSAWLDEHLPAAGRHPATVALVRRRPAVGSAFQAAMFDAGWLLPGHPPEFGGRNAPLLEQFVIQDELSRRQVYHSFNPQGLGIIAPSILMFGTPEQKQRWAVPLLRTEITAALGMSEPNAGSDLAGLSTRAVLDGDEFVVNGQKVWTSGAHDSDFILAFVRTDPDAPKHKGLSALIIPTDSPGVTAARSARSRAPTTSTSTRCSSTTSRSPSRTSSANCTRAGASPPARSARSARCCG